jgi:hypothetical protein
VGGFHEIEEDDLTDDGFGLMDGPFELTEKI